MGQKINPSLVIRYLEQLSGLKSVRGDEVEDLLDRIAMSLDNNYFPSNIYFLLPERCSFVEAVMLNKPRSTLRQYLDQMYGTLIIGIEQSSAYVAKDSLFFAFAFEYYSDFANWINRLGGINKFTRNGLGISVRFQDEGDVLVTGPLSLLFLQ